MPEPVWESPIQPPESLVKALRRLLKPLIRMLMAHGISYPFLATMLKSVYVEVAEGETGEDGKRLTDSRINLMTGVHRKDIRRLRADPEQADQIPPVVSLGAHLVLLWTGAREYLDAEGRPIALPRTAETEGGPSFDGLVESLSKDVRPRAVLDEWLRLGIARLDETGRVCLNHDAFVPEKGFDEKAYFFGRNIRDHIASASYNLAGLVPPFLERTVFYDKLTADSMEALSEYARKAGMETLLAMNREAMQRADADAKDPDATFRMSFGIYFYSVRDDPNAKGE
jgi:Family of unknown function (DUF6502)